ncbi:hypothetical protein AMIS_58860 [Actinoplanes missouriensis 431]|uniref:Uncharacterized protein n=1 Tax=Actinoplanes missouriensis (strain ATCC 14538 / DSM 43046 / CBS 188.64 / JCM 3121 / NBRC 102363 / NCIMB 12654 / NRRL B-3342 / UNCC 431) TaxID=512565 RepID=I0HDL9_ACTM4|nr:hypothetical protein [Actinoplanes missouriensis]BAL91106.1 hypothetical protein AMIS_58860 [Actinoplanes missouriensis 431]
MNQRVWTGEVGARLRCCICGDETVDADDYVLIQMTASPGDEAQWFGAHAAHLNSVLKEGFRVEIHEW